MNERPTSPRVRLAARLYSSAAVATKREAAEAAGLNPSYFSVISSPTHSRTKPGVTQLVEDIDQAIHDRTIQTSAVLELLGREALVKMRGLMNVEGNLAIAFKATQDLLDRSPDTSKIQKHALASFSLQGEDAKELAAAMVRAAEIRAAVGDEVLGDYVRIPVDPLQEEMEALNAGQGLLSAEVRQVNQGLSVSPEGCGRSSEGRAEDVHSSSGSEGPAPDAVQEA